MENVISCQWINKRNVIVIVIVNDRLIFRYFLSILHNTKFYVMFVLVFLKCLTCA